MRKFIAREILTFFGWAAATGIALLVIIFFVPHKFVPVPEQQLGRFIRVKAVRELYAEWVLLGAILSYLAWWGARLIYWATRWSIRELKKEG